MSDGLILNAGSGGATLATDDIGGIHYQIQKLAYGALDSATLVDTTNRMPTAAAQNGTWNITNISGTVSLPTGAATAAKQPALGTAGSASSDVITVQGIASMTALKVDGSGVTQPVSGTFWQATQPVSAASLPLPTGASTAAKQPALGTAGTASTDVLTIQGIAGMTKLLVTPDSVALPANQSVNVSQLAGTTTDTNSGVKSAGTLRVVLATDQPQLTNKLLVTPDANSAVNLGQIAGTSTATGNGTASAGCQRVTIASDNTAFPVSDLPVTSGGLSFVAIVASAASNNKTQVKGSAGQLYFISAQNLNASPRYLKVFNNTSAGVTAGTTAADYQFMIPGNTAGAGLVLNVDKGIAMGTGITIMVTGAIGATDNTSISANEVTVLVGYK